MRNKFKMLVAIAATAALALTGCAAGDSGGDSNEPFKVVAFTSGNQTPVGAWWVKAVTAKAEELGWDLTMVQGDFDFQKMNPAVESAIGQGTDAVFDGYTDVASIGSIVTAASDAGVPIFAMDSATEATDAFVANVIPDQQLIVDETAGAIEQSLGTLEGKNIMVIGHDPHAGIRERSGLAVETFTAAGANVVGGEPQQVISPATGRDEALKLVADYLAANPGGLDAVWTGWDDAAMGAVKAISEAGSSAVVTGVDAISESIAEIEAGGPFIATVEQPWPAILDTVIGYMVTYSESGDLPSSNFETVGVTLVTAENAASITPSDKL